MITLDNGKYAIQFQALKKDNDEPSVMADYLSQVAVVTKQDDFLALSLLFQSEQTITGFQIDRGDGEFVEAIEKHVDEEMERRSEAFALNTLHKHMPVRVQYEVAHEGKTFEGDEMLRLVFDEDSLKKVDESSL